MTPRFLLPGIPGAAIERIFHGAAGNEIAGGKFDSPESSARLAANAFGYFLERPGDLPPLPNCPQAAWPARSVALEATVRFPWSGGRHPVLDCLVATGAALIGIESKRFEPFRAAGPAQFSDAYWRPCWGDRMKGYEGIRDALRADGRLYAHLDAAQLVKHAFALRTQVSRPGRPHRGLAPILFYVYSEPDRWPTTGERIDNRQKAAHRAEIDRFAEKVAGDEATFVSCSYRQLLDAWRSAGNPRVRAHADAIESHFSP